MSTCRSMSNCTKIRGLLSRLLITAPPHIHSVRRENMRKTMEERAVKLGEYISEHRSTVRDTAAVFGVSKSTVHKDITTILPEINSGLYKEVREILDINKEERHLRGGEATRNKYLSMHRHSEAKAEARAGAKRLG